MGMFRKWALDWWIKGCRALWITGLVADVQIRWVGESSRFKTVWQGLGDLSYLRRRCGFWWRWWRDAFSAPDINESRGGRWFVFPRQERFDWEQMDQRWAGRKPPVTLCLPVVSPGDSHMGSRTSILQLKSLEMEAFVCKKVLQKSQKRRKG